MTLGREMGHLNAQKENADKKGQKYYAAFFFRVWIVLISEGKLFHKREKAPTPTQLHFETNRQKDELLLNNWNHGKSQARNFAI